jgi:hypothetical protein
MACASVYRFGFKKYLPLIPQETVFHRNPAEYLWAVREAPMIEPNKIGTAKINFFVITF